MSEGLGKKSDSVTPKLQALLSKSRNTQGAFSRVYSLYQYYQTQRFETMNASEGERWDSLNPAYEKYKITRYGGGLRHKWIGGRGEGRPWQNNGTWKSWPGGGRKLLLGTSTLAGAAIGPGGHGFQGVDHHVALFSPNRMVISVVEGGKNAEGREFDYPHHVADKRPFMKFSDRSILGMQNAVSQFILEAYR